MSHFNPNMPRLLALILVVAAYGFTRLPAPAEAERARLAAAFAFEPHALPVPAGAVERSVRAVHPELAHIDAWISSVGAAVALADLDADGLANDVCYVHTGTDQVIVAPATEDGATRYAPFALSHTAVHYDNATMAPMGCVPGDLNEDGAIDLLVYYWGRPPVAFLRAAPALAADAFAPVDVAPAHERWFTNALTRADVDGDGHVDLIVGNYFADGAAILDAADTAPQRMQHSMSRAFNGGHNRILLWQSAAPSPTPDVRFHPVADAFTEDIARGWTLAVGAADLDGDLLPELYFANDFGPDRLLHNRSTPGNVNLVPLTGERTLTMPKSKVVGRDSFKGMGVDFADVNGDGYLDIYVSNIAAEYALEESHFLFVSTGEPQRMRDGVAPYIDASESLGVSRSDWGWDARLADFNNDGILEAIQATGFVRGAANRWPELHELAMTNDDLLRFPAAWPQFRPGDDLSGHAPNPFFVRAADGRYYDLAADIGLGQPQVTRGIAVADVDGDGALDFAFGNQWEDSIVYRNACPACGQFVGLRLLLPLDRAAPFLHESGLLAGHGYPAIGASVVLTLPDGRTLVGQVDGGNGHSGVRAPELHFGLGEIGGAVTAEIAWRAADGATHTRTIDLAPGWHTLLLGNG